MTIVRDPRYAARKGRDFLTGLCTCATCEGNAQAALPAEYAIWCETNGRRLPDEVAERLAALSDAPDPAPSWAILGVDLGKRTDFSAVALLVPDGHGGYRYPSVNRLPLASGQAGTAHYRTQAGRLASATHRVLDRVGPVTVLVDATGVGQAVIEMVREQLPDDRRVTLIPVVITGGREATHKGGQWNVSKTALLDPLVAALEQEQVTFGDFPDRHIVRRELLAFKVKPSSVEAGPDRLEAEKQGDHDDTVVACALAMYAARRDQTAVMHAPVRTVPTRPIPGLYRRRIS